MKLIGNRVFLIPNRLPLVNQDKYSLVLAGDHYKLNFGTLTSAKSPYHATINSIPYFNKLSFTIANTFFDKKSSAPPGEYFFRLEQEGGLQNKEDRLLGERD